MALLFAICGACSEFFLTTPHSAFPNGTGMLPIPFALLCAILFLRQWRAIIAVPLMVVVWLVARMVAAYIAYFGGSFLSPLCGGFIGGFGLVLSVAICHGRLFSRKYVLGGATVGSVSALAFAPSVSGNVSVNDVLNNRDPTLLLAFAVWQAAVGTYLYAIVQRPEKETLLDDSAGLTVVRLTSAGKDGTRLNQ